MAASQSPPSPQRALETRSQGQVLSYSFFLRLPSVITLFITLRDTLGNLCIFCDYMNVVGFILIALFQKFDTGTSLTRQKKKKKEKLLLRVTSRTHAEKHSGPNLASLCACRSECLHFGRN